MLCSVVCFLFKEIYVKIAIYKKYLLGVTSVHLIITVIIVLHFKLLIYFIIYLLFYFIYLLLISLAYELGLFEALYNYQFIII